MIMLISYLKLLNAENDDDVKLCLSIDECQTLLLSTGFCKAISLLTVKDVPGIIEALLDYHLLVKVKASLDQFIEGLCTLNFFDELKANPLIWKPYFIYEFEELTAEYMKKLFANVVYAIKGHNQRGVQEQAFVYFCDFMDECEAKQIDCKLKDILIFSSGAETVPPIGFAHTPKITFINSHLPTASTCDVELRLPTTHTQYKDFREYMILGIKSSVGFIGV
jgi:hypothetical protein